MAQDRLGRRDDGRVVLTLKSPWAAGTRDLLFEPLTLLEKLAALMPRPRSNLVLYHGGRAPHGGWRARVVAYGAPPAAASACPEAGNEATPGPLSMVATGRGGSDAARLRHRRAGVPALRRGAAVDATVEDPDALRAILAALAESGELAERAPPLVAAQPPSHPVAMEA